MKKILVPSNYEPESSDIQWTLEWFSRLGRVKISLCSLYLTKKEFGVIIPLGSFMIYQLIIGYGLGKYGVEDLMVDKWQLYKIGKYCDELVETNYPIETTNRLPLSLYY